MSAAEPQRSAPGGYFGWLDPLRFFAAWSVVAFHLGDLARLPLPQRLPGAWLQAGFLGVDLFFAISGAVIALSAARLIERSRDRSRSWRRAFAVRRLARLVPLYFLTSFLFVLLVRPELLQRPGFALAALAHALFVPNLFASTHGLINGPTWSLGVEMQFYALMLVLAPWLLRRKAWQVLALGFGLAALWRLAVWHQLAGLEPAALGNRMFVGILQLPGVLDGFAAGIAAMLWRLRITDASAGRAFPWLLGLALLVWWLLLAVLFRHAGLYWSHWAMLLGMRAAVALASGLLVAALLAAPARFSPGRLGRWMGDVSYGIYLWHLGAILLVLRAVPDWSPAGQAVLAVACTAVLAHLGWTLVERPVLGRVRRPRGAA